MEEILGDYEYFYYMGTHTFNLKKVYKREVTPALLKMIYDHKVRVFIETKDGDIEYVTIPKPSDVHTLPVDIFGC